MAHTILARVAASVSELKKNPMATVAAGHGEPVAILNRNEPAFYCVPADRYEAMIEAIEDAELAKVARERLASGETPVRARIENGKVVFDGE